MIDALIGVSITFLIVVLGLLFWKRKPDPKIAVPINNILTSQGFILLDQSDPIIKEIKDAFRSTAYTGYVEQAYRRMSDDYVVCWTTDSEDTTNRLIAKIPQTRISGAWILFFLPSIKGIGEKIIRKGFELSVSDFSSFKFSKVKPDILDQSVQFDLYIQDGTSMPSFKSDFLNLLPQCGNIVLRSTGSIVLLERISIHRTETWEQEARELLRITQLLKGWL